MQSITYRRHTPNGQDVALLIRLQSAITRIGLPLGFDGDPLDEDYPGPRTHDDIVDACELLQMLPPKLRNYDRRLAHGMCKAAVFGRTRGVASLEAMPAPDSTVDAKLQRERRRASA